MEDEVKVIPQGPPVVEDDFDYQAMEQEEKKRRLMGILGKACIGLGLFLLLICVLNFFVVTWIQVGPGYLPLIAIDLIIGFVMLKQSNE